MRRKASNKPGESPKKRSGISVAKELDLHGQTIDAAMRQVHALVSRSNLPGGSVIRIIHGYSNAGEDSIKVQLQRLLQGSLATRIQDFYLEPFNPGATLIVLEEA
jgi:DNA-nicking Smr family endonuclease